MCRIYCIVSGVHSLVWKTSRYQFSKKGGAVMKFIMSCGKSLERRSNSIPLDEKIKYVFNVIYKLVIHQVDYIIFVITVTIIY